MKFFNMDYEDFKKLLNQKPTENGNETPIINLAKYDDVSYKNSNKSLSWWYIVNPDSSPQEDTIDYSTWVISLS